MNQKDTKTCTTCGTVKPLYGGTCLKCGSLLEPDDIFGSKPTPPASKTLSPSSPSINDIKSDSSLKTTIPLTSDKHPSLVVKDPDSPSLHPRTFRPPLFPPPSLPPRRNPQPNVLSTIKEKRTLMLMIIGTLLVTILLFLSVSQLLHPVQLKYKSTPTPHPTSTPPPYPIYPQAIGIYPDEYGENIGLSDGSYALDVLKEKQDIERYRPGSDYKIRASDALRKGHIGEATALWGQALSVDSNDAEAKIYLENQKVLAFGKPYVTVVLGCLLTDKPVIHYSSRDQLQGAYIAQLEHNSKVRTAGGLLLRLLIAKSGNTAINSVKVAHQIVQAAKSDKTIVGVLGWSTTTTSLNVLPIFTKAHLPLVSSSARGDELTGRSPYFFRVVPPNKSGAAVLAKYTEAKLKLKRLVVVYEEKDPFSQNFADSFTQQFMTYGHQAPDRVPFQRQPTPEKRAEIVRDVLRMQPDGVLLVGSGSADLVDFSTDFLKNSNVKVLTSGGQYASTNAPQGEGAPPGLIFVASAFPDEWKVIVPSVQEPSFFSEYNRQFDPNNQHGTAPYGYQRPNAYAMLAYDAALVFIKGIQIASAAGQQGMTGDDLQQALFKIKDSQAVQGVTGQISFGDDGDPVNKENLVLELEKPGHQLRYYEGCFLVGDTDCGGHFV